MTISIDDATAKMQATNLRTLADVLDPPVVTPTPVPTPPPPVSTGFIGRSTPDSSKWSPWFQDDFNTLCAEGQFLTTYKNWGAYPNNYVTTNKLGVYEPNLLSVQTDGSVNYLNCRLRPKSNYSDGKSRSTCAYPKAPQSNTLAASSIKWEMRFKLSNQAANWHAANLGWPTSYDSKTSSWPAQGETDYWEQQLNGQIGCYFHNNGATSGGDQVHFSTNITPVNWNVLGYELVAGQYFAWFINGQEVFADNHSSRLTSRIPTTPQRINLQLEDGGSPTQECNVLYDWVTAWSYIG